MQVGNFEHNPDTGLYTGQIKMRTIKMPYLEMHLIPPEKRRTDGPVYKLMEPDFEGEMIPVAELWENEMRDGRKFYAGAIDDHVAKEEKNFRFWPKDDADGFDVTFKRPSQYNGGGNTNGNGNGNGGQRGGYRGGGQRSGGGFSGGSTAGPGGEYVGGNGSGGFGGGSDPLDDDVPF